MVTSQNLQKEAKNVFALTKTSQDTEIVQNYIFDMLLWYNKAIIYMEPIF